MVAIKYEVDWDLMRESGAAVACQSAYRRLSTALVEIDRVAAPTRADDPGAYTSSKGVPNLEKGMRLAEAEVVFSQRCSLHRRDPVTSKVCVVPDAQFPPSCRYAACRVNVCVMLCGVCVVCGVWSKADKAVVSDVACWPFWLAGLWH